MEFGQKDFFVKLIYLISPVFLVCTVFLIFWPTVLFCKQTLISRKNYYFLIYLGDDSDEDEDDEDDADQNILSSDEDEIDEESAMYLESLQDKLNKSTNGNISVSS